MINLPTIQEVKQLHEKYAKSDLTRELVYTHSRIVAEIALQINKDKALGLDSTFIEIAALIHDIGAYAFISPDGKFDSSKYILHGITGYKILKKEKYAESLCRICERHTGVGITKEEVIHESLPLPLQDYIAETLEEELIMYSDKFHSKGPCFNSFSWYSNYVKRFGEHKVERFKELAEKFGIPNVNELANKYAMPLNT